MSADPKLAAAPPVAQPTAGGRCPGGVVPAGPFGPAWLPYGPPCCRAVSRDQPKTCSRPGKGRGGGGGGGRGGECA